MVISMSTGKFFTPQAPLKTFRLYKKTKTLQQTEQIDYLTKSQAQYSNLYGTLNTRTQSDTNDGSTAYLSQSIKVGSGFGITNLQERFRRMWLTNEIIASKIPNAAAREIQDCQSLGNIIETPKSYIFPLYGGWFMNYLMKIIFDDQTTEKLSKRQ